jgi:hypothetical protein
LHNFQNEVITNHVDLIVSPSVQSGSCLINIVSKTISSGGIFDYSSESGNQGKVVFTNYIGSCILRLMATFSATAGSVSAGQSCTASSPSAPDQTRVIKASNVRFVSAFSIPEGSIIGGSSITYKRRVPCELGVSLNF